MTIYQAILLGILQGITEFLPISSSGHLVIGQTLLGIKVPGNAFEVIVHLGTFLAVIVVFKTDIRNLLFTLNVKESRHFIYIIIVATIPSILVGFLLREQIGVIFERIDLVAYALIITGLILFATKFTRDYDKKLSIWNGIVIGIAQAIAIIPGISRSGFTIATGLLAGMSPQTAIRFSFLLALPAIAGAGLLTALNMLESGDSMLSLSVMAAGFISSFLVGWLTLKWLIQLIRSGKLYWFGFYCVLIGLILRIY